jgi:hypothetical protein
MASFRMWLNCNGKIPIRRFLMADLQSLKIVMAYFQLTLFLSRVQWRRQLRAACAAALGRWCLVVAFALGVSVPAFY